MKKILFTVAIVPLYLPHAYAYELVNTDSAFLEVYGQIKANAKFYSDDSNKYTFGDSKVGVEGKYAITDELFFDTGIEVEVNVDNDEDIGEDQVYLSQYYAGLGSKYWGSVTYGKSSLSSEDLDGVDYSEVFGGEANLNSVGVKTDVIKYQYSGEFYKVNTTYGFESGDQKRDIAELFVNYKSGDISLIGGYGRTTTNSQRSKTDTSYSQVSLFLDNGDYQLGSTFYYRNKEDNIHSSRSVESLAGSIAGRLLILEDIWTYSGYEYLSSNSDTQDLDGDLHNVYLGLGLRYYSWLKVYGEANYKLDDIVENHGSTNFGLGMTIDW